MPAWSHACVPRPRVRLRRATLGTSHTFSVTDPAAGSRPRGALVSLPPRRWIAPALIVVLILGLLIGVGGHRLYVSPAADTLAPGQRVDAIIAVGGMIETATYAQSLVEQQALIAQRSLGKQPVLVLSDPYSPNVGRPVHRTCASRPSGYRIICFSPHPSTTRGEAREIRTLAQANGWTRIAVVAPSFHISRARVLFRRCYPHTLLMLAMPTHVAWDNWTYQYVRQTLGYAKVAVLRHC
jgi:uncharacterized SAM-binding protein YcdF (DUF218 family)